MKLALDLSDVQVQGSRIVLPTGGYNFEVISADAKQTLKGGGLLTIGLKVLNGEHLGDVIYQRLNIVNANADAQRIALSELKTIMAMGGHRNPDMLADTDDLIGLKLRIKLEEVDSSFENKEGKIIPTTENKFKSYSKIEEENTSFPTASEPKQTKAAPVAEKASEAKAPAAAFPWAK